MFSLTYRLALMPCRLDNVSRSGLHMLLEGGTGVGKSATVETTARMQEAPKKLVRYNLSRNTTIDELIGQVKMETTSSGEVEFRLQLQPFATAFRDGDWLLLDEMNLAQDTVLQCIEQALDTGVLEVPDHTSSDVSSQVIEMHKEFRLFGTQNPNAGHFKGKREQLSQSFLGRFLPVTFEEYPESDWKLILQQRLAPPAVSTPGEDVPGFGSEAESVAEKLASFRSGFVAKTSGEFSRAHAVVSIRQLLEVIQHLLHDQWSLKEVLRTQPRGHFYARVGFEVWCTFCGRFREVPRAACLETEALLQTSLSLDDATSSLSFPYDEQATCLKFEGSHNELRIGLGHHVSLPRRPDEMIEALDAFPDLPCQLVVRTHRRLVAELLRNATAWGVVIGCNSWWRVWASLYQGKGKDPANWKSLMFEGCVLYAGSLRHDAARRMVIDVFKEETKQHNSLQSAYRVDPIVDDDVNSRIWTDLKSRTRVPRVPIALTARFRRALTQLGRAVRVQLPTLITGPTSSGKTTLVLVLAELCQIPVRQVYMTAETESSLLVGSVRPKSGTESGIAWEHGVITQCVQDGTWALLDNLAEADSCVLERLNPCLESKVDWRLTERGQDGDGNSMEVHDGFRFVATMTTGSSGQQHELSPALYNRFTIVHLDPIANASYESAESRSVAFKAEMERMIESVLPANGSDVDLPTLIWNIWQRFEKYQQQSRLAQPLNLRSVVRFLDSVYRLSVALAPSSGSLRSVAQGLKQTLVIAFEATMSGMFKVDQDAKSELEWLCKALGVSHRDVTRPVVELDASSSVVITASRKIYTEQLYYADICNLPVLLEGPAAVGKTALVHALCKTANGGKLYRVNNTQTTTIEDYLGSQMPTGGGFQYQDGELVKAMKNGGWFLADEFNLADPNIMSMLSPLLEGQGSLRLEGERTVTAHPAFRFFATQNDSNYAGRNKLPPTLRARFLEMQVHAFEKKDIVEIWDHRIREQSTALTGEQSELIATVYSELRSDANGSPQVSLTMREIDKWCGSKSGRFGRFKKIAPHASMNELLYCSGLSLLLPRFVEGSVDHDAISRTFEAAFSNSTITLPRGTKFSGRSAARHAIL